MHSMRHELVHGHDLFVRKLQKVRVYLYLYIEIHKPIHNIYMYIHVYALFRWHCKLIIYIYIVPVGGFNPSEKYLSVGMLIPSKWNFKKCSKPPTRVSIPSCNER
jgi:hypothetical protein